MSFAAPRTTLSRHLLDRVVPIDLIIGGSHTPGFEDQRHRWLEFGFPSFFRHALFDSPFLGFRGWAWFVQAICNALMTRPRAH